jgi:hypothetical protein
MPQLCLCSLQFFTLTQSVRLYLPSTCTCLPFIVQNKQWHSYVDDYCSCLRLHNKVRMHCPTHVPLCHWSNRISNATAMSTAYGCQPTVHSDIKAITVHRTSRRTVYCTGHLCTLYSRTGLQYIVDIERSLHELNAVAVSMSPWQC